LATENSELRALAGGGGGGFAGKSITFSLASLDVVMTSPPSEVSLDA